MVKKVLKKIPLIIISIMILAVSINMFLSPHKIAAGGVSGIGVLIESAVNIDRAIVVLILNIAMLLLAFIFLGKPAFLKSVVGSLFLPAALAIVPEYMVVEDRILSVVVGSIIFAIAVSVLYSIEASSGGTTIPPLIMKKYFGINTSIGLLVTDLAVVIFNIFIFGVESFLFAIVSLIITSVVMTYLETGMNRKKAVIITSENSIDEIYKDISENIIDDSTILQAFDNKKIIVTLLDNSLYPTLIKAVDSIDSTALVIAYNVAKVHGVENKNNTKPWTSLKKQMKFN